MTKLAKACKEVRDRIEGTTKMDNITEYKKQLRGLRVQKKHLNQHIKNVKEIIKTLERED